MGVAAERRRDAIMKRLSGATTPLPATRLGHELGVSRQIIVGDIALLRAARNPIRATNRGYLLTRTATRPRRVFHVHHRHDATGLTDAADEMGTIIDAGGSILDVSVAHDAYGPITVDLNIRSRADLTNLLDHLDDDSLLCRLTNGRHTHLVEAHDTATLDAVERDLERKGFLEGTSEPVTPAAAPSA